MAAGLKRKQFTLNYAQITSAFSINSSNKKATPNSWTTFSGDLVVMSVSIGQQGGSPVKRPASICTAAWGQIEKVVLPADSLLANSVFVAGLSLMSLMWFLYDSREQ